MDQPNLTIPELYSLLKDAMAKQTEEINKNFTENIQNIGTKFDQVDVQIDELRRHNLWVERNARKNNIIVFGLDIKQGENVLEKTLATLNTILDTNLQESDINNIYLIGKKSNPPVKVELVSFLKKTSLFKDKEKLQRLNQNNIAISNDLSVEDRSIQKKLRLHLKQARERNIEARIKGDKLVLEGKTYTLNELDELETIEVSSSESEKETGSTKQEKERPTTSKSQIKGAEELHTPSKSKQKKRKIKTFGSRNINPTRTRQKPKQ